MYAYRVAVKSKDGAILELPLIGTKHLDINEAIQKSLDLCPGRQIVSVSPASLDDPRKNVSKVSQLFFDIKELAHANAQFTFNGDLNQEQLTQVYQMFGIIKEKITEASRRLEAIDATL